VQKRGRAVPDSAFHKVIFLYYTPKLLSSQNPSSTLGAEILSGFPVGQTRWLHFGFLKVD
jgi:hypothetical protein